MDQRELFTVAEELASRCEGADLPSGHKLEHSRIISVLGQSARLTAIGQLDVGHVNITERRGDYPLLSATVFRNPDDPDLTYATMSAKPHPTDDIAAMSRNNASVYSIGSRLRSHEIPLVSALGEIAQDYADLPAAEYGEGVGDDKLVINRAAPGNPLVKRLDRIVDGFTSDPTRIDIHFTPFYGYGTTDEGPFILKVDRSSIVDYGAKQPGDELVQQKDYEELDIHAETPHTYFALGVSGPESTVTAYGNIRPYPAYEQLVDPTLPLTNEMIEAADNYPEIEIAPPVHYEANEAVAAALLYMRSVSKLSVDRKRLFE